ncbi:MAG TPA: alpha/beta fold hydrolase [Solirubrobacteraceae bacterium]|nr:alpha/beta fold hydrolase [Solirubrobacteraceae bacterium]
MRSALAVLTVLTLLALPPAASAAAPPPPGANVACTPTAAHPYPVVLVHGTFENRFDNWLAMSPALKRAGYCVYALNYGARDGSGLLGIYGIAEIERSARELRDFVADVRARTGAAKVSLVGHSQGGLMPRYFIKYLGGAAVVDDLVGLSPSNHGTTNPLAPVAGFSCPACRQQVAGSPFLVDLNAGDETPGDVSYTQVVTRYDEVVVPYTSGFLAPDANVTNLTLQDVCPGDTSEHLRIPYDPPAIALTRIALGRPGPADPGFRPACATL